MAKILQEGDYISKRKRKYLIRTIISLGIMMIIFIIGLALTKTRNNMFTLFSVLFTLVVAQYGVQYISIMKYRDGDPEISKKLSDLPDIYIVWHSALFGDQKGMAFFDHIIITDKKIYCMTDQVTKSYDGNVLHMKRIVENKGLKNQVIFIKNQKDDFIQLINTFKSQEIKNFDHQEQFVEALKSAAI